MYKREYYIPVFIYRVLTLEIHAKMVPVFAHENETAMIADGYPFSR